MTSEITEEFRPYQTDLLFVLVGENPLPNCVAANILLRPGGHLYLVYSEGPDGTGDVAQRLSKHLTDYQTHLVPVNEHNSSDLQKKVGDYLEHLPPGAVGLNYTGGTKFMAVHTHEVVETFCRDEHRDFARSYLHADTLELAVEAYRDFPAKRRCVVDAVPLTFGDVFALHGLELHGDLPTEPQLPDLAHALVQINSTPEGVEAWRECRKLLFANSAPLWREARAELSQARVSESAICEMETTLGLDATARVNLHSAARKVGLQKGGSLRNWLDGGWLEDWTLGCIKELKYTERFRNLDGRIPGKNPGDKPRKFEIDVGVMRGYQLFALSCKAVASWSDAKLGLMEVFARSRQMGGEEARAALVMTHLDNAAMEQEFSSDWGADKRIRVFGCKQLLGLKDLLQSWFEEPTKGGRLPAGKENTCPPTP